MSGPGFVRWQGRAHRGSRWGAGRAVVCLVAFCFLLAHCAEPALARVINVPSEASTIQEAVDSASEGDTVLVAPGVYEDFRTRLVQGPGKDVELTANVFLDKAVVLKSQGGAGVTTIQGAGFGPVIVCSMVHGAVLEGFTISGGDVDETVLDGGGGIYCDFAEILILDNVIERNSGPFGGGIGCFSATMSEIRGNVIRDNRGDYFGGAVALLDASRSTIGMNVIANNEAAVYGGGVFLSTQCSATMENNTIVGNSSIGGSALFCRDGAVVAFVGNIAAFGTGNAAVFCDTLGTAAACAVSASCNDFWGNEGGGYGGCQSGPGDIDADPLFCSYSAGDYSICVFSPSSGTGDDCGRRGALGPGCWNCPMETGRLTWGLLKTLYR